MPRFEKSQHNSIFEIFKMRISGQYLYVSYDLGQADCRFDDVEFAVSYLLYYPPAIRGISFVPFCRGDENISVDANRFSFIMSPVLFCHLKDRGRCLWPFFSSFLASESHALAAALVSAFFTGLPLSSTIFLRSCICSSIDAIFSIISPSAMLLIFIFFGLNSCLRCMSQ